MMIRLLLLASLSVVLFQLCDGKATGESQIETSQKQLLQELKRQIGEDKREIEDKTDKSDGMDKAELKSTSTKFMFVVRDFLGSEDVGTGLANGQKYINIEKERGTTEHKDKWQSLQNTFSKIECLLLPHPGLKIMTKDFKDSGTLTELDKKFVLELDSFFRKLFAPENLIPNIDSPTGKNIYDTLNKVNGRQANNIQSFFQMFTEEGNADKLEKLIDQFNGRVKLLEDDLQSAQRVMMELQQTGTNSFKGKSAKDYSSRLTERMQEVLNNHVRHQIITEYGGALGDANVERNHRARWPSIVMSLEEFVGGLNKRNIISEILQKLAEKYYDRLRSELYSNFKHQCTTGGCSVNPSPFEECMDFETAGGSESVLQSLWSNAKSAFHHDVRSHERHIQNLIESNERWRRKEEEESEKLKVLGTIAGLAGVAAYIGIIPAFL